MRPQVWEVWNHKGQSRRLKGTRREVSALCKSSNPAWRRLRWIVARVPVVTSFLADRKQRGDYYREVQYVKKNGWFGGEQTP